MMLKHPLVTLAPLALLLLHAAPSPAAEITEVYPNGVDGSLQATVERLCLQASDDPTAIDTVTIQIAPGTYREQVSTTIACHKDVNWRLVGAGVGQTVITSPMNSEFKGIVSTGIFSTLLACGGSNPWTKPSGEDICEASWRDPNDPNDVAGTHFVELCKLGAREFVPFKTSCEISDMTIRPDGGRALTAVGVAWAHLIARNLEVEGFPVTHVGCQNCQDALVENVRVMCRPPGSPPGGLGIPFVQNSTFAGYVSSGNTVQFAEVQGCGNGVVGVGQSDGLITDVHVTDAYYGIYLVGAQNMTVSNNRVVRTPDPSGTAPPPWGTQYGIAVNGGAGVTLSHNRLVRNLVAGIGVRGLLGSTVSSNQLVDNKVGISIEGEPAEVTANKNFNFGNDLFIEFIVTNETPAGTFPPPGVPARW